METDTNLIERISTLLGTSIKIINEKETKSPSPRDWTDYLIQDHVGSDSLLAVIDQNNFIIRLYLTNNINPLNKAVEFQSIFHHVVKLSHLEVLFIWGFPVERIPEEIAQLRHLESLVISGGASLTHLAKEITQLPRLRNLKIDPDLIQNIPPQIVTQGIGAVKNYFESIEQALETSYLYEAKLVFIGRGFAGKTSLIRKLIAPNYKLEKYIKSTEGIDIKSWDLKMRLPKSDVFRFNIWDFGGQEKYDATHQFFITERTLYIFVTEARQESNYLDFDYWLSVVQILGNESPVIVVQNKIDERQRILPEDEYLRQFPNIVGFVNVSCTDGYEYTIDNLINKIKDAVKLLPQIGEELPKEWVDIRRDLKNKKEATVPYDEYVSLCEEHGLSREKADFLGRYYHDLGVIVHYATNPSLRNTVILNPDWAVDGVYNILDAKHIEENKGRFNSDDLKMIWNDVQYKNKQSELLALMKTYGLCFELSNGVYIAPGLLSPNKPDGFFWKERPELSFVYKYSFMPAGVLTRLIVKLHNLIENDYFWRQGVIIGYEGARALITEDEFNKKIVIEIVGQENKKELLAIVRNSFNEIHTGFKRKIQYEELVPCNCVECREDEKPHFYKWITIKKFSQKGVEKVRCEKSTIEIEVNALIGEITNEHQNWVLEATNAGTNKIQNKTKIGKKADGINKYSPLIVGLSWWGVLVITFILFAFSSVDKFYLVTFVISFIITFPIVIGYALLDRKILSQKNFITILKMSFSKIPGLKWINK